MKKLRVGVWLNENIENSSGGAFSYYNVLINNLINYKFKDAEIILISDKFLNTHLKYYQIKWTPIRFNKIFTFLKYLLNKLSFNSFALYINNYINDHNIFLINELYKKIDLIYYLTPDCKYPDFPYIFTLWDLGHHTTFCFPEITFGDLYINRLNYHDFYAKKALCIFAESESGKNDIVKYLNIPSKKIKVVPIFPSSLISDEIIPVKPSNITEETTFFIHYPAQFWAHKNHYNLLVAFKSLLDDFSDLKLIFTGSDKGNKNYINNIIKDFNLNFSVFNLGFISNAELKWIYLNSSGLVMPTFLGPTNMPLLEAAELNCPVACSNIDGHLEQLGSYGYYFNPESPEDITSVLKIMLLENKGKNIKKYISSFNINNSLEAIDKSFKEITNIRNSWGEN
jgi:glycosyltransferase involved in cell wall biosynthesis